MSHPDCIRPEEIDVALAAPAGDPRSRHLRECPRCRALADEYRLFVDAGGELELAEVASAGRRLRESVARELAAGGSAVPPAAGPERPRVAPAMRAPARSWWERLTPALRPALGLAAVLVVAAGALLWPRLRGGDGEVRLRGTATDGIEIAGVATVADGLRPSWRGWPGADAYELRLYSAGELREVARLGPVRDTALTIRAADLPAGARPGDPLVFRVFALAGGDAIASSPARPLPLPPPETN